MSAAVCLTIYATGWVLLTQTSASLLLPNSDAAKDRLQYALSIFKSPSLGNLKLRLQISFHLLAHFLFVLPLAAYLWTLDEVLFGSYRTIAIRKPIITISVPRGGTTSFHRTLAMDERLVTPRMLEIVSPFLCIHKLVYAIQAANPNLVQQLEDFLKWINGVTPEVEARHPISLFAPDADDILLGEWHWVSVGACRTFPVVDKWLKHYQMDKHLSNQRKRALLLHKRMCQKILYNRGKDNESRLLLRSHLSTCAEDFQTIYPDAQVVGILREPVDVLQSFAGLSGIAIYSATGVDILAEMTKHNRCEPFNENKGIHSSPTWPAACVEILSDMMGRESALYGDKNSGNWRGRCRYTTFPEFKADPLISLQKLYKEIDLGMTDQFKEAIQQGLRHHETYKKRQVYRNPTLKEMGIEENELRELPNVRRYANLLQQRQK